MKNDKAACLFLLLIVSGSAGVSILQAVQVPSSTNRWMALTSVVAIVGIVIMLVRAKG